MKKKKTERLFSELGSVDEKIVKDSDEKKFNGSKSSFKINNEEITESNNENVIVLSEKSTKRTRIVTSVAAAVLVTILVIAGIKFATKDKDIVSKETTSATPTPTSTAEPSLPEETGDALEYTTDPEVDSPTKGFKFKDISELNERLGEFNYATVNKMVYTYEQSEDSKEYLRGLKGIINTRTYDFDSDGDKELLVLHIVERYMILNKLNTPHEGQDYETTNVLVLSMYEHKDGKYSLADEVALNGIFNFQNEEIYWYDGNVGLFNDKYILYRNHYWGENCIEDNNYINCYEYKKGELSLVANCVEYTAGAYDGEALRLLEVECEKLKAIGMKNTEFSFDGISLPDDMMFTYKTNNEPQEYFANEDYYKTAEPVTITVDNGDTYNSNTMNDEQLLYSNIDKFINKLKKVPIDTVGISLADSESLRCLYAYSMPVFDYGNKGHGVKDNNIEYKLMKEDMIAAYKSLYNRIVTAEEIAKEDNVSLAYDDFMGEDTECIIFSFNYVQLFLSNYTIDSSSVTKKDNNVYVIDFDCDIEYDHVSKDYYDALDESIKNKLTATENSIFSNEYIVSGNVNCHYEITQSDDTPYGFYLNNLVINKQRRKEN